MNKKYTGLWTDDFSCEDAKKYDDKFLQRFEKNVKHRQQVCIVEENLPENGRWLDFPIGTARLMRSANLNNRKIEKFGFDYSEEFIDFSGRFGIQCQKQNLLESPPLEIKYDLITSLHTIFAFDRNDQEVIIENYVQLLNRGGGVNYRFSKQKIQRTI